MKDYYYSIEELSTGEFRDRGSKFIAYAYPVKSEDEAKLRIAELWKLHSKARHVCYAYRLGPEKDIYRINDDGEPSGTAGKPIYNSILSAGLENILVAVVRYFGGTKLGTSGLINAYKTTSQEALAAASKNKYYISELFQAEFEYRIMGELLEQMKKLKINILQKNLGEEASLVFEIRKSKSSKILSQLKANLLKISVEQVNSETKIPACSFKKIEDD